MRSRGLKPKHLKALELLAQNKLSVEQVASQCGIKKTHLYDLIVGNEKGGPVAQEFSEEYKKVADELTKQTDAKIKKLRDRIVTVMAEWFEANASLPKKISQKSQKQIIDLLNSLNKAAPTINIGSLSYSKGLSGEDLSNEFRRLNALAGSALNGSRIQCTEQGQQGLLPPSTGTGNTPQED